MKIGTRISPDWLDRPEDLSFLTQIGVDCVDITMSLVSGYEDSGGRLSRDGLSQCVDILGGAGLVIERINSTGDQTHLTFMGRDGSQQELDNLVHNAELCGEFDLPVMGIQCFQASQFGHFPRPIHQYVKGRGGYEHAHMDLRDALGQPPPEDAPTAEEIWERTLKIFRTVVPVAESAGVKIAMHGNDPPVTSLWGVPQVLTNFAAFDRLFSEVPSPHNGMTFCVGTRYESGEDVFEGIKHFGGQGKIFHVHFRNVHGTIPGSDWYEETIPDAGDLSMFRVAKALHEVGYEGAIDYDHLMKLTTDDEHGRQYMAFCVGHMRGILEGVEDSG
jgi:mannonate dehydratase